MALKVGIVGARSHSMVAGLKSIPDVEVTAVCDLNEEMLKRLQEGDGIPNGYRIYEDMLASDIDAVVIATPMQCHVPQAILAFQAGKHVLSEVPAAVTMDELFWLIQEKEKAGKTYMMAENYAYTPEAQQVKNMRALGFFGTPYYAEGGYLHDCREMLTDRNGNISWRNFWQYGRRGNFYPTHSTGPVMEWFTGDRIVEISCFGTGGDFVSPELRQDEVTVTMCRLESGALAKITVACKSPRPHNMYDYLLQGTKGIFESAHGMGDQAKVWLKDFETEENKGWRPLTEFDSYMPERYKNPCEAAQKAGHRGGDYYLVEDFVKAIKSGEEPDCSVYRAAEWTAVGLLSELSCMNGSKMIKLPHFQKGMAKHDMTIKIDW